MDIRTFEINTLHFFRILNDVFIERNVLEDPVVGSVCIDLTLMNNTPYSENMNVVINAYGEDTNGLEIPVDIDEIVFSNYEEKQELRIYDRIDCVISKSEFFDLLKILGRDASKETAMIYRENTDNFIEEIKTIAQEQENTEQFCVIGLEVGESYRSVKVEICYSSLTETKILSSTTLFIHDESDLELQVEEETEIEES